MNQDLGSDLVINLGFGGSTLEACVYFFDRILLAADPSSLVLYAGDNDLGDGKSSLDVLSYYRAFASKMKDKFPEIRYGFISIKPSVARQAIIDKISAANEAIKQEIATNPMAYYVDVYSQMLDNDGKPRKDLYQPDGLHLNADGYRLWTTILLKHRDQIFNENFRRFHEE
jgi:lysophospholipase L1-like esterase